MTSLYFNPDNVFLVEDRGREYPISILDASMIYGAGETYDHDMQDDEFGGAWGGKDEMNDDIKIDMFKSNKRFSEKKWLKPTKHSALDEIIDIIDDASKDANRDASKDIATKSGKNKVEKGGKLELVRSTYPKVLNPDDGETMSSDIDDELDSNAPFELSHSNITKNFLKTNYTELEDFKNSRSKNSKLELRMK